MITITLKNGQIVGLASWLSELSLHGKESRVRTRFVRNLVERHQENEKFRMELLTKYAKKDENGNKVMAEDGKSVILENVDKFVEEMKGLFDENYITQMDDESFSVLKNIVLDTHYQFGPGELDSDERKNAKIRLANDYEEWCQALEKATN